MGIDAGNGNMKAEETNKKERASRERSAMGSSCSGARTLDRNKEVYIMTASDS